VTTRLFWTDPYLVEFDARVLARREHEGRPAVVLDQTAFYAESGGQPSDAGTLQGVPVVSVLEDGDSILHVLAAPVEGETVHGSVDAERRRDHRQQHHGQHLLSRALLDLHRADTIGFHLGREISTVDLDREISVSKALAACRRANEVVWEARPVRVRIVSQGEAAALGSPAAAHVGEMVRLVEVEGFDLNPCGGTHPLTTAEVGLVLVTSVERYKGGSRIGFVCGQRALALAERRNRTLDEVAALLQAPREELASAARQIVERLAEADKRVRDLGEKVLDAEADALLAGCSSFPAVLARVFEGRSPEELRILALKLVRRRPCVALLGSRTDKAHVVFAQSEGQLHDIPGLLRDAVGRLGGRGGGRGDVAQGGGDRLEALDAAIEAAADAVRGGSR